MTPLEKKQAIEIAHSAQIINQIHDSVISTDLDGVITSWNGGSERLLGYTSEEMIGKHVALIYKLEDLPLLSRNINRLKEKGEHYSSVRLVRKSGEVIDAELSLSLLKDEVGDPIGLIGYSKDISDCKRAEDELAELNHMLQQKIEEEIKKNREKDKQLLLHSRQVQMGEMISMIAHQWRQPLSSISTAALNMKIKLDLGSFDYETKEGIQEANDYLSQGIDDIESFVQTLTQTIEDFRSFYKPNKKLEMIKLEEVCVKSLQIVKIALEGFGIKVIEEYNSEEELEVHPNELMQVVLNLLKNSQDVLRDRKIENPFIKITTENRMISICDNGGGVPEDIMKKIFDPYFSTKEDKNGTGLGLYMSKMIINEHHNGSLEVENMEDGACFKIKL